MEVMKLTAEQVENMVTEEVKEITLKYMQEYVQGYIEIPYISDRLASAGINIVINEEGKLINLKPTIAVIYNGEVTDIIMGNVLFTSYDWKGNTIGLTDKQVGIIRQELKHCYVIQLNGEPHVVRALFV